MFSKVLFSTSYRGRICIFKKKSLASLCELGSILLLIQWSYEPGLKVVKLNCEVFPSFIRKHKEKMLSFFGGENGRMGEKRGRGEKKQNKWEKIKCCELTARLTRRNETLALSGTDGFVFPSENTHENFMCFYL